MRDGGPVASLQAVHCAIDPTKPHVEHERCGVGWLLRRSAGGAGMNGADGIDPSQKEMYLSDEDFSAAFASDKATYIQKPQWRRILLKKKVGLF